MDIYHSWALWRLLVIGLSALPFVVAAVVSGFLQRHSSGSSGSVERVDDNASSAIAGPVAWGVEDHGRAAIRSDDGATTVKKHAA